MLSAGQALWRVGSRSFVVQHYRSRLETRLTDTDTGMTISDTAGRGERSRTVRRDSDRAMLALIGVVAGSAALVWVWGGLAGELFGGGWPRVGGADLLGVLVRLPAHVAQPAHAWPRPARGTLPRAPGCYAALGLTAAGITGLGLLAGRLGVFALIGGRDEGARWARAGELRRLRARRGAGDGARLALGRHRGRLLYAEHRHALVAFGPPQSGKSAGLAIPALLEWQGPGGRIFDQDRPARGDPRAAPGARRRCSSSTRSSCGRHRNSHLVPAQQGRQAGTARSRWRGGWRRPASSTSGASRAATSGPIAAEQRLAPLLFVAARTGGRHRPGRAVGLRAGIARARPGGSPRSPVTRRPSRSWPTPTRPTTPCARSRRRRTGPGARSRARPRRCSAPTASAASPGQRAAARSPPSVCSTSAATLYLIGDAKASKLLRPIFLALLSEVVDRAYERATLSGGRLERPLLLCLDEAGNVAPLPNLAEIASTAPSHNIQLVSIFHDLAQARSRYGKQAETVVNSHRARMLLPGVADLETLRYFSGLVGEEEAREQTRTSGAGGTTRSTARRRRPLVSAEALRQLPDGHALLLYGRLAPVRVRLRMWFLDRRLRKVAKG